jgi:hypothetical protein
MTGKQLAERTASAAAVSSATTITATTETAIAVCHARRRIAGVRAWCGRGRAALRRGYLPGGLAAIAMARRLGRPDLLLTGSSR